MEKHIIGENGISYTLGADGLYYPDLQLPEGTRYEISGAKTVPKNHANINKTGKSNENMPISAIESIGNISKNGIQIT